MDVPMNQKTDAENIDIVLKGDSNAYANLVLKYKTPIFNLACRMTGDLSEAEDLTQETFIRAYVHLSKFQTDRSFFTWLYSISINLIRNHLKSVSRRRRHENEIVFTGKGKSASGHQPPENVPAESEENLLKKCLLRLPEDLREVIVLRYYQGLSFEEIAKITGKSQSAVKMRTYRGLEKLKKCLKS